MICTVYIAMNFAVTHRSLYIIQEFVCTGPLVGFVIVKLGHRAVAMFGTFMMGVGWIGLAYSNSLITMLACHSLPGGKLWYAVDCLYGHFYGCTAVSKHQPHEACKRWSWRCTIDRSILVYVILGCRG